MPVRSTYKMADNICRSSPAGRPPFGWVGRSGINGRTRSHTASLSSHGRVRFIGFLLYLGFPSIISQVSEEALRGRGAREYAGWLPSRAAPGDPPPPGG